MLSRLVVVVLLHPVDNDFAPYLNLCRYSQQHKDENEIDVSWVLCLGCLSVKAGEGPQVSS